MDDMSPSKFLTEDVLNSVSETLVAIPERVRDESNGRYCYPEQYHNKVFRLGNKFLLFNTVSYEELSFEHIEFISTLFNQYLLNHHVIQSNDNSLDSSTVTNIIEELVEKIEKLENDFNLFQTNKNNININNKDDSEFYDKVIADYSDLADQINDLNERFNEIKHQLSSLSKIKELQQQLEKIISNYDQETLDLKNKLDNLNHQIVKINPTEPINEEQLINNIGNKIWTQIEDNLSKDQPLPVEYTTFKEDVENKFLDIFHHFEILSNQQTTPIVSSSINTPIIPENIQILNHLKQSGFTVDEIIALKNNNMI